MLKIEPKKKTFVHILTIRYLNGKHWQSNSLKQISSQSKKKNKNKKKSTNTESSINRNLVTVST